MSTRLVPETLDGALAFYANHLPVWSASAPSIGLSAAQTQQLDLLIQEADAARRDREALEQAARTAAQTHREAMKKLMRFGAGLIATIRGQALATDDRAVYTDAQIPAPRSAAPSRPPETPIIRSADIRGSDGAVQLTWSGSRAGGVNFLIYRRLDGAERAVLLASVGGRRTFIDRTVPFGTRSLCYHIVAVRGGLASGQSTEISVRLPGTGGPEARTKESRTTGAGPARSMVA